MIAIFGVSGFVGHHLASLCATKDKVHGFGHAPLPNGDPLEDLLEVYECVDLSDKEAVDQKVDFKDVKTVFHLAGLAAVGPSFEQPSRYISANTSMLINVAEKALAQASKARFIVISSGAIYDPSQDLPISEDGKLLSNSPYAVSKITTELLCDYYRLRGLDIVVARPFNHIGPGQGPGFILPDLTSQAKDYGSSHRFSVGNLETKRDYTDVRDVVGAYVALSEANDLKHAVYNVCSGQSYSGNYILDEICKNYSINQPVIELDQSKVRPSEIKDIRGDNSLIKQDTGWSPAISIEQSIEDFIKIN